MALGVRTPHTDRLAVAARPAVRPGTGRTAAPRRRPWRCRRRRRTVPDPSDAGRCPARSRCSPGNRRDEREAPAPLRDIAAQQVIGQDAADVAARRRETPWSRPRRQARRARPRPLRRRRAASDQSLEAVTVARDVERAAVDEVPARRALGLADAFDRASSSAATRPAVQLWQLPSRRWRPPKTPRRQFRATIDAFACRQATRLTHVCCANAHRWLSSLDHAVAC